MQAACLTFHTCSGVGTQTAEKALKKLLKKQKKEKAAAAAAEASPSPTEGRPRTRSMDLADATNGRPRTRSMDMAEGDSKSTSASSDSSKKKDKSDKKKKKKRKLSAENDEDDADKAVAPKKIKPDTLEATPSPASPVDTPGVANPEEFCATHKILVASDDAAFQCPTPMTTFESTPYGGPIRGALKAAGYPAPTPTQAQSWPIALSGRDIISVARTGSGKTLGFLLPAFHALLNRPGGMKQVRGAGPYIVVLAPTRELACQINDEATKFGKSSGIRSATVYGEMASGFACVL